MLVGRNGTDNVDTDNLHSVRFCNFIGVTNRIIQLFIVVEIELNGRFVVGNTTRCQLHGIGHGHWKIPLIVPRSLGDSGRCHGIRKVDGAYKVSQRGLRLFEDIVPQLGSVLIGFRSVRVHRLDAISDGGIYICHPPQDGGIDQHNDIVGRGCLIAFEVVRLDLGGDKFLEFVVAVCQEIHRATFQNSLLSVVLSDGHISLINGEKRPGPQFDNGLV
mmetsp:Transcript_51676/g.58561  ORF Transcript_51676/g.58561 Transcript_51676/m.58561 type:complete len:217 (+) Transcript_51676:429-1079(+)